MSPTTILATARKQRRYDAARAVLWVLIVAILILGLVTLLLVGNDIRERQKQALRNQQSLKALQQQNQELLLAIRVADLRRADVVDKAIAELVRRQQVQLDDMERRILARQAELARVLQQVQASQRGLPVPRIVLVPVPTRASPPPSPSPAPGPTATPQTCTPRGNSGKCK